MYLTLRTMAQERRVAGRVATPCRPTALMPITDSDSDSEGQWQKSLEECDVNFGGLRILLLLLLLLLLSLFLLLLLTTEP